MANFNGSEGGPIPLATARQWTANYRATIKPGETQAHYFGGDTIRKVLNESDRVVGLRIYYAIDDKGQKQLLLVGVDALGNNLLPAEDSAKSGTEGDELYIMDKSYPCPIYCGENPL